MAGQDMTQDHHRGAATGRVEAPADLATALRRIAHRIGRSSVVLAGVPFDEVPGLAVDRIDEPGGGGRRPVADEIVVLTANGDWAAADEARVVVSVELSSSDAALDALHSGQQAAAAHGRHVAHIGLLHVARGTTTERVQGSMLIALRPDDPLNGELDNGPLSLALDPLLARSDLTPRPARVLIASYEVAGPTGNGGIGTAYHSLAHTLAATGHDVTLLFTGWAGPEHAGEAHWRERFADHGIDFRFLGVPWDVPARSPHHAIRRAYELHRWLAAAHDERPFDVVHVPETLGHGAFAMTAKALGRAYQDVEFVVGTHSSTRWVTESNRDAFEDLDLLVTEQLERISVERADVVMSPTAYLLDYMRDRGWNLPARTFVQPLARPRAVRALASEAAAPSPTAPTELIFFGRLETRKGLEAFCDAVDVLVAAGDCPFTRIAFVGRPEQVLGEAAEAFIERRARAWRLPFEIHGALGHAEAVAHLRSRPAVVAIPSLVDNSPNTVIEVLALGVPFVASRSGGTAELIAPTDLAKSTFDGWASVSTLEPAAADAIQEPFDASALARALRAKAADHGEAVAPAVDDAACDALYDRWHRAIAGRRRTPPAPPSTPPLEAGVLVLADAPEDLRRIVQALRSGSVPPARIVAVGALPDELQLADVEIETARDRDAGPARRRAIERLDTDVVIVLRAHEQPDRTLVELVCGAMSVATDTDVLSLVCRDGDHNRDGDSARALGDRQPVAADLRAFVPAPGPALATIAYPALSVGAYAFRRSPIERIGGYSVDAWGETLDHELLARAALAGLKFDVLPDPVATSVRDDRWSTVRARYWGEVAVPMPQAEALLRLLRPFVQRSERSLRDLPSLYVGALRAAGRIADVTEKEAARRRELVDAYERRIGEFNELTELYERQLVEHRDLIALYERQKEELRSALERRVPPLPTAVQRLRRATRGPVSGWPGRGVRFARWQIERRRQGSR